MASHTLPNPDEPDNLNSPEVEHFPKRIPDCPDEKKSYFSTILRNHKFSITIYAMSFLTMIAGTVVAALFIGQGMQSIKEGQAALSVLSSSPTPTMAPMLMQFTLTKTNMVTRTLVMTGHLTIPISQLQSTIYAIATAPAASHVTCAPGDIGVTCGSSASRPE